MPDIHGDSQAILCHISCIACCIVLLPKLQIFFKKSSNFWPLLIERD